jgi:hypothetical protein
MSTTICDACNQVILSDNAIMDPDRREVLCPACCKREYPHYYRLREYLNAPTSAPAPVPAYERGDLP